MVISRSRWNVACHLLDGVLFFAALMLFSIEQVIPKMIADLSERALFLGLVPLIWHLGMLLPQVFYVKKVEGLAYKKPTVFWCAFIQRTGWLVFLLSLYLRWEPAFTLTVFFICLAVSSLGTGLVIPVWTDWYAKTVPANVWGRLLGMRRALPGVLGIGLGGLIRFIMNSLPAPERYRLLLILALVFYALALACVLLVREDRHEGLPNHSGTTWKDYFRDLAAILFRRRDFRIFVLASILVTVPLTVAVTFLTRYGLTYPGVEDGVIGTFTMVLYPLVGVGGLVGGMISDRMGVIVPFRLVPLFIMAATGMALASAHPAVVSTAWGLTGFALGVRMVIMLPAVFRFASPHRRPSYTALSFTTIGLASAAVPPLLGLMIDAGILEFRHVFALCGLLAFFGWLLFLRMPSPEAPPGPGASAPV